MVIKPKVRGFVCVTAHPAGCAAHVQEWIDYVKAKGAVKKGPQKVLVIGSSTGYGLASRIVTMIDRQHAFLINRNKLGSMALPGESMFVLEMQPASYAILATNEAEKAARIKVVDYRMFGATGRVYLSGKEADVRQAADAAEEALRVVT